MSGDVTGQHKARLPRAPVSVKTHGDPKQWTEETWIKFRKWALSLKAHGPLKRATRK